MIVQYLLIDQNLVEHQKCVVLTDIPRSGVFQIFAQRPWHTVQITFIFIDFRVCDFAFAFKTQNAPCVSRFKRVLFSDRFQFAF